MDSTYLHPGDLPGELQPLVASPVLAVSSGESQVGVAVHDP
jgi:hypothetical protein